MAWLNIRMPSLICRTINCNLLPSSGVQPLKQLISDCKSLKTKEIEYVRIISQIARCMGPTWGPSPVGPRWAPCWPHEPCCQGYHFKQQPGFRLENETAFTIWHFSALSEFQRNPRNSFEIRAPIGCSVFKRVAETWCTWQDTHKSHNASNIPQCTIL